MPNPNRLQAQWGALTGALTQAYERADEERYLDLLDQLGDARERELYRDLRDLGTRMRMALDQFRLDPRLLSLAGKEMPDARLRLDHALRLTEEAAHRTMDLVERSAPLAERTARGSASLGEAWSRMHETLHARVELDAAALVELIAATTTHLTTAQHDSEAVRANLAEVMIAQTYQDLTGQIIRSVTTLVAELENALARFVSLTAGGAEASAGAATPAQDLTRGIGPAIPGLSTGTLGEQNDVDALLAANGANGGRS